MIEHASRNYENLVETYFLLANALHGTESVRNEELTLCRNPMPHASCNFGIIRSTESLEKRSVQDFISGRSTFHIYSFCTEYDANSDDGWAENHGYRHGSTLIALTKKPNVGSDISQVLFEFAENSEEREAIAEMIALQFFPKQTNPARRVIVSATAGSNLPLARIVFDGKTVGAIMLCRTPGAIGVYNFFIEEQFRGLGIGSQTMLAVTEIARKEGCIICLQSDLSLVEWYEALGFQEVGHVDIWVLDHFRTVAIIG